MKTVDLLGKAPSVTATVSRNQGLTNLEGVGAAMKHMNNMAKAVSLASAPKDVAKVTEHVNAVGNFHIHLEPVWLFLFSSSLA